MFGILNLEEKIEKENKENLDRNQIMEKNGNFQISEILPFIIDEK